MALGKMLREGFDQVLQLRSMRGRMPSWKRLRPGLSFSKQSLMFQGVFVHSSVMFTLFGPHTFICDQKHSSEE